MHDYCGANVGALLWSGIGVSVCVVREVVAVVVVVEVAEW